MAGKANSLLKKKVESLDRRLPRNVNGNGRRTANGLCGRAGSSQSTACGFDKLCMMDGHPRHGWDEVCRTHPSLHETGGRVEADTTMIFVCSSKRVCSAPFRWLASGEWSVDVFRPLFDGSHCTGLKSGGLS